MLGYLLGNSNFIGRDRVGPSYTLVELCGGSLTLPEAGRTVNVISLGLKLSDQFLVGSDLTSRIYTDMGDMGGPEAMVGIVQAEHLIKRGHTVSLRRRYLQHVTNMIEASGADPSLGVLQRVKGGKQQVAVLTATVCASIDETLRLTHNSGGNPYGGGDGSNFDLVGYVVADK